MCIIYLKDGLNFLFTMNIKTYDIYLFLKLKIHMENGIGHFLYSILFYEKS